MEYHPHAPGVIHEDRRVRGLHPQEAFHEDRYRVRYRACLAGTGAGKTAAASFEAVAWALDNPGSVGILCEPDFPMVRRVLIPALERHVGRLETTPVLRSYNKTEHRLEYVNGSVQWLLGLEDPGKAEGPNVDYVWVDEARLVRRWVEAWLTLKRRLRGSRPGMRTGAWISTHSPTREQRDEFENPTSAHGSYEVYRWSTRDNPVLPPGYVVEAERSHTGAAYRAVVLGEFARASGLVYTEFEPTRNVRAAPARSTVNHTSYGVDWGWSLPACIVAIAWQGEIAHVVREWYQSHASIDEIIQEAKTMQALWGRGRWWCGADQPRHIQDLRDAGLDAAPFQGRVVDGVSILNGRMRGGELLVDPACTNVLRELDLYSYPPGQPKEEPEKGNDHAMDAIRYGVLGGHKARRSLWSG